MREILFRGKMASGEWLYGDLRQYPSGTKAIRSDEWKHTLEVIPDTVGQYTGLTDKNGKKIFEGDVIRAHYANVPPEKCEYVEKVVFRNGRFCGMYENGPMKTWAGLPDGTQHLPGDRSVWMDWCEVIGNIHDNPSLIGGTE